jgi:hypothetical protein
MSVLKVTHMVAARNFDVMPNKLEMKNIFLLKAKKKKATPITGSGSL